MAEYAETQVELTEDRQPREWHGPAAFRSLRHRDFAIYWIGLIISTTGSWMQGAAQSWLAYDITGSKFFLGMVGAFSTAPVLFLTLPFGVVADRLNKRKITIVTQTLALLQALALAVLAYSGMIKPWHILALASFSGLVNAIDIPARQAMTSELVDTEDMLNAVSLNSSAFNGARIAGPFVAGVIMAAFAGHGHGSAVRGPAVCFLINSVSFLGVIIGLLMIRPRSTSPSGRGDSAIRQLWEGLVHSWENRVIRDILLLTGIASVFGLQYPTLLPALAKDVLGQGPKGLGTLMAAAGTGALLAGLTVASIGHRFRPRSIVTLGSIVAPVGIVALSFAGSLPAAIGCIVFTGFGMMMFLAVSNSIVQVAAPDTLRGRILSVRTFVFIGMAPIGAFLVGALAERFGVQNALRIGGVLCLVTGLGFAFGASAARARDEAE